MTSTPSGEARPRRLLLCISEPISSWISKGEVVDRYYNPGDLFDEVHLLLINTDEPDPAAVQRLVGRAQVTVHNLPTPRLSFLWTLAWRPLLLRWWTRRGAALAASISPDLIRCHGPGLNALMARDIKRRLGIPYAVSLHINPDEDQRGRARTWKERLQTHGIARAERVSLRNADVVLPVYQSIVPYLRRLGVHRVIVAYNVLNGAYLQPKGSYSLGAPPRVVCVGRQFEAKDPTPLIRSIAAIPDVELTLVGDGPLHERLREVASAAGVSERVHFHRALPNDELCKQLRTFDIAALHTEYWELSKVIIESLLIGLPLVVNRRQGAMVPELRPELVRYVTPDVGGYRDALVELLENDEARRRLGTAAAAHAAAHWAPASAEAAVVAVYRSLLGRTPLHFPAYPTDLR